MNLFTVIICVQLNGDEKQAFSTFSILFRRGNDFKKHVNLYKSTVFL